MQPITSLRSLCLETPTFAESIEFYTRGFGLTLSRRDERTAAFTGAGGHGSVLEIRSGETPRLLGLTFTLASSDDLRESQEMLAARGMRIFGADGATSEVAFAIDDPDGRRIAFVADDREAPAESAGEGGPLFLSHVVLNSPQPDTLISFFVGTLGFTITDRYENNLLTFLRCAQPQHHCIGISPGGTASLNHFSIDCGSIDSLMKSVGRMQKNGLRPIWGPGRHGPGGNVFCYFEDPAGFVPEFTCDILQIEDEKLWVPREWPRAPDTANVWGTGGPSPRAIELMSGHR